MIYTYKELTETLRAINSIIHKCEKAQEKFPEGNSHHTLLRNRMKAMYISKALIAAQLTGLEPSVLALPSQGKDYKFEYQAGQFSGCPACAFEHKNSDGAALAVVK